MAVGQGLSGICEWETVGAEPGRTNWPNAVAVGASVNIFVTLTSNYRVLVFSPKGDRIDEYEVHDTRDYWRLWVTDVAADKAGALYFVDGTGRRVIKTREDGTYIDEFSTGSDGYQPLLVCVSGMDVYVFCGGGLSDPNGVIQRYSYE